MEEENTAAEEVIEVQQDTVEETPTTGTDDGTVEKVEETPEPTSERTVPLAALEAERHKRQESERNLAMLIQNQQRPPEPVQTEVVPQRPTLEQFEYDDDKYQDALVNYRVEEQLKVRDARLEEQRQTEQKQRYVQDYQVRVSNSNAKGIQTHADYQSKVMENPSLHVTPLMADVMSQSENGHDIVYHLGCNPAESSKIAQMPAHLQAAAIGRLEAKLSAVPAKTITNAPKPIDPVGGGGGQPSVDDDSLTDEEWAKKYYNKG